MVFTMMPQFTVVAIAALAMLLLSSSPTNAKKGSGDCRAVVCEKVTTSTQRFSPLTPDDWWRMDLYGFRSPGRATEIQPAQTKQLRFQGQTYTQWDQTWRVEFLRAHSDKLDINYDNGTVKAVPNPWTATLWDGPPLAHTITLNVENCHLRSHGADPYVPC